MEVNPMNPEKPHALNIENLCEKLQVNPERGLDAEIAEERLQQWGPNSLAQSKSEPWWKVLSRQFRGAMVYLLLGASFISLLMGEKLDAGAILVVILINGLIGFLTEFKAGKAMEALRQMTTTRARVLRNGIPLEINSEAIVPGDIILLEAGDVVPADSRLFEGHNFAVDEASLTGESLPIDKNTDVLPDKTLLADRINCVFSSSAVVRGTGRAIVYGTGHASEIGRISEMLSDVEASTTPLEKRLERFSRFMIWAVSAVAGLVFIIGALQGRDLFSMIQTGIALAIAAVPEGLPFVATMTLAFGVYKMAGIKALVRNLAAVETLGSTTVICTDKTGTITQNHMTVHEVRPASGKALELLLRTSALCNNGQLNEKSGNIGDPLEIALLKFCEARGTDPEKVRREFPRLKEEPFDSSTMRMVTWHREGVAMKGAPERLFRNVSFVHTDEEIRLLTDQDIDYWQDQIQQLASVGMRTLAFAWGKDLNHMALLGVVALLDPPRNEVAGAVHEALDAGIHAIMVTGDHLATARYVATQVGIVRPGHSQVLSGEDLENISLEELGQQSDQLSVLARVAPEHKLKLVQALQASGEVVAMTGDGVNDAVALKQADVGIAMGIQGTEVSKEASDIILQDDRFSTIVHAVAEGRRIFDNIRKAVLFLLCCNLSEVLTVLASIVFKMPSILLPLQILWINLITDVVPALSLAFDPAEPDLMDRPPKRREEDILTPQHRWLILLYGLVMALGVLSAYMTFLHFHPGEVTKATEIGFHTLVIAQLFFVFNVRKKSMVRQPSQLFLNPWLLGGVVLSLGLQAGITYIPLFQEILDIVPLSFQEWSLVIGFAMLPTLLAQIMKLLRGD